MMKKITCVFTFLALTHGSLYSQVLNQAANWPNANWNVGGTYNPSGLLNSPDIDASFTFDDDAAGSGSDEIWAESPVIDLTAAALAGETRINITGDYLYEIYNGVETLAIEYWDADASSWVLIESLVDNDFSEDFQTCNGLIPFTSDPLMIASFSATQLSGFKYRFRYDDGGGWEWGFCFGSPTIISSTPPPNDLGISMISLSPSCGAGMKTVNVEIKNYGSAAQTGFTVTYAMNGNPVTPEVVTGTVAPYGTLNFSFSAPANLMSNSSFKTWTNLITDTDNTNDTLLNNIDVIANSLSYSDSAFINDELDNGTTTAICTDGLVSGNLGTCTEISALVIDSLIHTYTGDLDIYLISPNGTMMEISTDNNGGYEDMINVTFTDTAMTSIDGVNPVPNSYFQPEEIIGFSIFNGEPSEGIWKLYIVDDAGGDDGAIFKWHLEFNDLGPVVDLGIDSTTCSDANITLDAGNSGSTFLWSTGETTQQITVDTASLGGEGTYSISVMVTDGNGCSNTDAVDLTFSACASVDDINNTIKTNIFPNPNQGVFTLSIQSVKNENMSIRIINAQGQEIISKNNINSSGNYSEQLNLSENAKGVYFILIVTDNGVKTERFVLN